VLKSRFDRPTDHRRLFRSDLQFETHASVFGVALAQPTVHRSILWATSSLAHQHAAIPTTDALQLRRGERQRQIEQRGLVLRRGCSGERANLRVADAPRTEGSIDQRKIGERMRDPHLLPRGAGREPDAPRQPLRARGRALHGPAAEIVEAAEEHEEAMGGGVKVRREFGKLIGEDVRFLYGRG
jgi:hypothetical protein